VTRGGEKTDIAAIPRHIGQRLPKDELRIGQPVFANGDDLPLEDAWLSTSGGCEADEYRLPFIASPLCSC